MKKYIYRFFFYASFGEQMMHANTNQAEEQLKPIHVCSIKKEPHRKEIMLEQRKKCKIRAFSIQKRPLVIRCNRKQNKYVFFFLSASLPLLWI
jgi:hypothetical protein